MQATKEAEPCGSGNLAICDGYAGSHPSKVVQLVYASGSIAPFLLVGPRDIFLVGRECLSRKPRRADNGFQVRQ
jgi:hypothetical protein